MRNDIQRIAIIGTGNVGYHLSKAFLRAGLEVVQVVAHSERSAERFSRDVPGPVITVAPSLLADADVYILAVNDDRIDEAAEALNINGRLVVHTSGSVPMEVLQGKSSRIGVLYPLQTLLYGHDIDFHEVPVCVEAARSADARALECLAVRISGNVLRVNSEKRRMLHLAAVFASNFTYHMYTIAADILKRSGLDPDLLHPLITETVRKSLKHEPGTAQTGPASRQDLKIIEHHLTLLEDDKLFVEIYRLLTDSIIRHSKDKSDEL